MARALVDTSILFAAAYSHDSYHEEALPILRGLDDGSLPEAIVPDYVLAETMNGLLTKVGHDAAVDLLDRIERNARFHVQRLSNDAFATAKSRFRRHPALSLVDACLLSHGDKADLAFLYSFDDDFDRFDTVSRLATPTNPYDP